METNIFIINNKVADVFIQFPIPEYGRLWHSYFGKHITYLLIKILLHSCCWKCDFFFSFCRKWFYPALFFSARWRTRLQIWRTYWPRRYLLNSNESRNSANSMAPPRSARSLSTWWVTSTLRFRLQTDFFWFI